MSLTGHFRFEFIETNIKVAILAQFITRKIWSTFRKYQMLSNNIHTLCEVILETCVQRRLKRSITSAVLDSQCGDQL